MGCITSSLHFRSTGCVFSLQSDPINEFAPPPPPQPPLRWLSKWFTYKSRWIEQLNTLDKLLDDHPMPTGIRAGATRVILWEGAA